MQDGVFYVATTRQGARDAASASALSASAVAFGSAGGQHGKPPPPGQSGGAGVYFWARLRRGPQSNVPRAHVRVYDTVPLGGTDRVLTFFATQLEADTISCSFAAFEDGGLEALWFLAPDDGSGGRSLRMGAADARDPLALHPPTAPSGAASKPLYLTLVRADPVEYDRSVRNAALNPLRADDYAAADVANPRGAHPTVWTPF